MRDWTPYSKARLLVQQMETERLTYAELASKFASKEHSVRYWVRSYHGFMQAYQAPGYAGVVDERAFTHILEVFSNSGAPMQRWLGWDEDDLEFKNKANFTEFLSWLYPKPDGGAASPADFDRRYLPHSLDLRKVSRMLRDNQKAFEQFRREHDINAAGSRARVRGVGSRGAGKKKMTGAERRLAQALDVIKACTRVFKDNPYRHAADERGKARLRKGLGGLREALDVLREEAGEETPIIRR